MITSSVVSLGVSVVAATGFQFFQLSMLFFGDAIFVMGGFVVAALPLVPVIATVVYWRETRGQGRSHGALRAPILLSVISLAAATAACIFLAYAAASSPFYPGMPM